jgi:hypothetical protein
MPRTVIVGDLHACKKELADLLDHIGLCRDDDLVCVGDLVVRGPFPRSTLDLLMGLRARAVRGNHEDKLLRWRRRPETPLGSQHREVAEKLRERHWAYLASLPLWLDLPDHAVRVVHAGVVPGLPIELQDRKTLLYVRCLGPRGEPLDKRDRVLWGARYVGPPHVVFGHNALPLPQLHPWATGIDTGAVYGGRLTAMVLRKGEKPPQLRDRLDVLVSVPSRRKYAVG